MSVSLSVFGGVGWQFFTDNGVPLSGGKIYTYQAGTTTPVTTYTDSAGSVAHTNPIILNAAGRVPTGEIWLTEDQTYKFVVNTSTNVLVATYDNVSGGSSNSSRYDAFVGNGVKTQFLLSYAPVGLSATQVYINGIYQQKSTYSVSNKTITFTQAPPTTATVEVVYV